MARMYKSTNDAAILDQASCLIDEWAKAMDHDGYFYYSTSLSFLTTSTKKPSVDWSIGTLTAPTRTQSAIWRESP